MSVVLNNIGISLMSSQPSTLLTGLMGYWKLDETSGGTIDSSGNNYTGTGSNLTYNANGKIGRCYTFNGTDSRVTFGNVIKPTTALSISLWMKDGGQTAEKNIINTSVYDGVWRGWRFTRYSDQAAGVLLSSGTNNLDVTFGTTLSNDNWYHIVFTWNGTTAYVYINNVRNSGWSWSYTISYATTHNLTFGANQSGGQVYDGEIDEVGVWNRALTSNEVSILYNSGSGLTHPFS